MSHLSEASPIPRTSMIISRAENHCLHVCTCIKDFQKLVMYTTQAIVHQQKLACTRFSLSYYLSSLREGLGHIICLKHMLMEASSLLTTITFPLMVDKIACMTLKQSNGILESDGDIIHLRHCRHIALPITLLSLNDISGYTFFPAYVVLEDHMDSESKHWSKLSG